MIKNIHTMYMYIRRYDRYDKRKNLQYIYNINIDEIPLSPVSKTLYHCWHDHDNLIDQKLVDKRDGLLIYVCKISSFY